GEREEPCNGALSLRPYSLGRRQTIVAEQQRLDQPRVRDQTHETIRRLLGGSGRQHSPLLELAERSEEHTSELQSRENLVCRLLLRRPARSPLFPYTTLFRSGEREEPCNGALSLRPYSLGRRQTIVAEQQRLDQPRVRDQTHETIRRLLGGSGRQHSPLLELAE